MKSFIKKIILQKQNNKYSILKIKIYILIYQNHNQTKTINHTICTTLVICRLFR